MLLILMLLILMLCNKSCKLLLVQLFIRFNFYIPNIKYAFLQPSHYYLLKLALWHLLPAISLNFFPTTTNLTNLNKKRSTQTINKLNRSQLHPNTFIFNQQLNPRFSISVWIKNLKIQKKDKQNFLHQTSSLIGN